MINRVPLHVGLADALAEAVHLVARRAHRRDRLRHPPAAVVGELVHGIVGGSRTHQRDGAGLGSERASEERLYGHFCHRKWRFKDEKCHFYTVNSFYFK